PARTSFPTRRSSDLDGNTQSIWVWKNGRWEIEIDTSGIKENAEAIEQAKQDIEEAQQTADEAVEQIDTAVANAGFTSLDETISSVQSISNQAQINAGTAIDNALEAMNTAGTAIDNALEAMQQASQAVENTGSLNVRVDDVENTLSVKADKQTVDDLTGVVDLQALDIKANADGLKLKANQDTVDLIDGRVSSLGTEVDAVAGQISSKVWNTDIESAIDGIEVGGRNLFRNSDFSNGISGWSKNGAVEVKFDETIGKNYIDTTEIPSKTRGVYQIPDLDLVKGQSYTISLKARTVDDEGRQLNIGPDNRRQGVQVDTEWRTYSVTYTSRSSDSKSITFYGYNVLYTDIKLEKGNKATDWTPAPEDTDAKITS